MGLAVAKKKTKDRRIEFRVEEAWYKGVEAAAERRSLSVAAYIRLAVFEKMDRDESQREDRTRE